MTQAFENHSDEGEISGTGKIRRKIETRLPKILVLASEAATALSSASDKPRAGSIAVSGFESKRGRVELRGKSIFK